MSKEELIAQLEEQPQSQMVVKLVKKTLDKHLDDL